MEKKLNKTELINLLSHIFSESIIKMLEEKTPEDLMHSKDAVNKLVSAITTAWLFGFNN